MDSNGRESRKGACMPTMGRREGKKSLSGFSGDSVGVGYNGITEIDARLGFVVGLLALLVLIYSIALASTHITLSLSRPCARHEDKAMPVGRLRGHVGGGSRRACVVYYSGGWHERRRAGVSMGSDAPICFWHRSE